jgi:hypothetical protein
LDSASHSRLRLGMGGFLFWAAGADHWWANASCYAGTVTGIQFVTDEKGRKTAVLIDLKRHKAIWEDFWDGLVSESRLKEKRLPYDEYRAERLKRTRERG